MTDHKVLNDSVYSHTALCWLNVQYVANGVICNLLLIGIKNNNSSCDPMVIFTQTMSAERHLFIAIFSPWDTFT